MRKEQNPHTATYLIQKFIASGKAHELKLDPYDLIILYTIARFLDMPLGKCFGKQVTLAHECLMSRNEFQRRSLKLYKLNLVLRYLKGKLYHYELGYLVTGIEEEVESTHWVHVSPENGVKKPHKHLLGA